MKLKQYAARIVAGTLAALMMMPATAAYAKTSYKYSTGTGTTGSSSGITSKTWTQLSDNTWTMDVNGDGTIDVTLEETVNSDGDQEWTYTFNVADDKTAYYVYEEMTKNGKLPLQTDYTSKGSDGKSAIPQDPGQADTETKSYTIKNQKDHEENPGYGSLTLTKAVTNPDNMKNPDQEFLFTIKLSSSTDALKKAIDGTKIFGETVFKDGVATVALKHNGSITITDIPAGMTYTITETALDEYTTASKNGDTGAIVKDSESKAEFKNTTNYTPPQRDWEYFYLTKKVNVADTEGVSDDTEYTFNIMFDGLVEHDQVIAEIVDEIPSGGIDAPVSPVSDNNDGTLLAITTADATGIANMQISIKNGQIVRFFVPVDSQYQVEEVGGDYVPSYEVTMIKGDGEIASSIGTGEKGSSLSTGKETADSGEYILVTYTNTITRVQDLVLEKKSLKLDSNREYVDNTEDSTQYSVTASFKGLSAGQRIKTSSGILIADEDGEIQTDMLIERNQKITFYDVPVGTTYKFTETANDKVASYEITGESLKAVKTSAANTVAKQALSTETEKVDVGENAVITFTNKKPETAKLQVIKFGGTADNPGDRLAGAEFALYKEDGTPVNFTIDEHGNDSNIIVTGKNGASEILESGLFVPGKYYLVETKAPEWYSLSGEQLAFEITQNDIGKTLQLKAYDTELVVLPVTGDVVHFGIYIIAFALVSVAVAAYAAVFLQKRYAAKISS